MLNLKKIKLFSMLILTFCLQHAFALENSIEGSSVNYDDPVARNALFTMVPKWNTQDIQTVFAAYKHPERYALHNSASTWKYNVLFINAFWGLKNNPFLKIARPAKIFVFYDVVQKDKFNMAPLVQNAQDGNYYVFDKNENAPELLDDWIAKNRKFSRPIVRFNVCNGYADMPSDSCADKTFDDEERDMLDNPPSTLRANANPNINISAVRKPNENWRLKIIPHKPAFKLTSQDNIYDDSIAWQDKMARNNLLAKVVTWPNYQVIKNNFLKMRDARYFKDTEKKQFIRRISWLYPDDGCWTRATAMIKDFFGPINNIVNQYVRPNKLFVFGNLCVNTSNSPNGSVMWWYHTAPIVKDAQTNKNYVLDPSVNPYEPMLLEDWINTVAAKDGKCGAYRNPYASVDKINVCDGYGTNPFDACHTKQAGGFSYEVEIELSQHSYQRAERARQIELGRDADKVLGDFPPWK